MRPRFKYISWTLVLFSFLFLPFLIKTIDMRLEIFPSVIFPSSSGTINLNKDIVLRVREIYGMNTSGAIKKVDKSQFLQAIPRHYFDILLSDKFGLEKYDTKIERTNKFNLTYTRNSKVTDQDIVQTKAWIQSRLRELGLRDSVLIIKIRKVIISKGHKTHDYNKAVNDTIFNLYR